MNKILLIVGSILLLNFGGCNDSPTQNEDMGNGEGVDTHNDIEGYRVVFVDHFNTPPLETENKWNTHPWWGREHSGNGSVMYYADESIEVDNGYLKINVDKIEDQSELPPPYNNPAWFQLDYTSGSINTHGKFEFTYGIVKFRAKAAKEKGIWPAVWMIVPRLYTVQNDTWGPEIDILEMSHLHRDNPNVMGGYLYWTDKDDSSPGFHIDESYHDLFNHYTNDWHDYELHWLEDEIIFYFDGHKVIHVTRDLFNDLGDPPHSDWIANIPMYLMINVAVGAHWMQVEDMPDGDTQFPIEGALMVDYIKVYQKIE